MSEVYLGEAPSYVKDWCKRNTYLTIEALDDGISCLIYVLETAHSAGSFQIQLNDNEWINIDWFKDIGRDVNINLIKFVTNNKSSIMLKGDKLRFRNIDRWTNDESYAMLNIISITNQRAIVYGKLANSVASSYALSNQKYKFGYLFYNSPALIDASALNLDGIEITEWCYHNMFSYCNSLSSVPKFSYTSLANNCYNNMFDKCSLLTAIHFPKAFQDDETILKIAGSDAPWFGATSATIYYDL